MIEILKKIPTGFIQVQTALDDLQLCFFIIESRSGTGLASSDNKNNNINYNNDNNNLYIMEIEKLTFRQTSGSVEAIRKSTKIYIILIGVWLWV